MKKKKARSDREIILQMIACLDIIIKYERLMERNARRRRKACPIARY